MEILKHLAGLGKEPIREQNGWKFHYLGWDSTVEQDPNNQFARKFATRDNIFLDERKGKLDIFKLQQHGLTKEPVHFADGILFMHGACDGATENIMYRWNAKYLSFNEAIVNTMTCTRWHEIKRNLLEAMQK